MPKRADGSILALLSLSKRMPDRWTKNVLGRLNRWLRRPPPPSDDIAQARALIAAIDRGGVPLNPAKINAIARNLGLEVSRHAAMADTIERIRQAILRST